GRINGLEHLGRRRLLRGVLQVALERGDSSLMPRLATQGRAIVLNRAVWIAQDPVVQIAQTEAQTHGFLELLRVTQAALEQIRQVGRSIPGSIEPLERV